MYEDRLYWVCLQQALGYGNSKFKDILSYFNTAENLVKSTEKEWRYSNIFTPKEIAALKRIDLESASKIIKTCDEKGYGVVTIRDEQFPERLRGIYNPPAVLYVKGTLPKVDESISISIVGTRDATQYGISVSFDFGYKLAKAGVIIISGGAVGIDSSAQKGAVLAGGKVISVLGCGLDCNYLSKNKTLRDIISKDGALVSEFPPDRQAMPQNFPIRNRIISGLSLGTLVVEAGEKSGSFITANLALEQNKDLFAVPGDIKSAKSVGTNRLIKECAKPVTQVEDILEDYYLLCLNSNGTNGNADGIADHLTEEVATGPKPKPDVNLEGISQKAKILYGKLQNEPVHIDELIVKSGLKPADAMQAVTELELNNLIKSRSAMRYSK